MTRLLMLPALGVAVTAALIGWAVLHEQSLESARERTRVFPLPSEQLTASDPGECTGPDRPWGGSSTLRYWVQ
jgi:hypothetical protein